MAKAAPKTLKVTQIKSVIGCPQDQRGTVRALGLHRINDTVVHTESAVIRGMIFKVKHLVTVEEI